MDRSDEILSALRRIMRAVDIHSRKLIATHGMTAPQYLVLKAIGDGGPALKEIAEQISLSTPTVNDILNRLEERALLYRERDAGDRRKLVVRLTAQGRELLHSAPPLLQESFVRQYSALPDWEQTQLLASVQRISALMGAETVDASPVLSSGTDLTEPG